MSSSVRSLLSAGSTPLDSLEKKLNDRRHKLQAAVIYGLESESALQLIKERLNNLETSSSGCLISADSKTVKQQNVNNEACMKQVGELASSLHDLTSRLGSPEKGDEVSGVRSSLRTQADSLSSRLRALENVLSKRQVLINVVRPLADDVGQGQAECVNWLQNTEYEIESIKREDEEDGDGLSDRCTHLKVRNVTSKVNSTIKGSMLQIS